MHLNPVRANLLTEEQSLREFVWSSYPEYLKLPARRPAWIRVDRLLGEMRIPKDSTAGRAQFERRMETRRGQESQHDWKDVRRGWCLGEDQFRRELLAQIGCQIGENHFGSERAESAEAKAARIVAEELGRAGWTEGELGLHPKGDPVKLAVARRLRRETTVTLKWISDRLAMGAWTHLNRLLYEQRRGGEKQPSCTS